MIIVTGGFGFIGSNLIHSLNARSRTDITVIDDLTDGTKFTNLVDCQIADYVDISAFRAAILADTFPPPHVIFHQGACSSTTEWNGKYMLENNFTFCKELFHYCQLHRVPFIYASSAAVYGLSKTFLESPEWERPVNLYGYSKLLFDQYVRARSGQLTAQVVGLRYFNVYGPRDSIRVVKQALLTITTIKSRRGRIHDCFEKKVVVPLEHCVVISSLLMM